MRYCLIWLFDCWPCSWLVGCSDILYTITCPVPTIFLEASAMVGNPSILTSRWPHEMWAHHHNPNCIYIPNCFVVISCVVSPFTTGCQCHLPRFAMVFSIIVETRPVTPGWCLAYFFVLFSSPLYGSGLWWLFMMTFVSVCAHCSTHQQFSEKKPCRQCCEGRSGPVRLSRSAVTRVLTVPSFRPSWYPSKQSAPSSELQSARNFSNLRHCFWEGTAVPWVH